MQRVAHLGETVKLVCPVDGYPTPMVEWSKDGEKIDFMWERHKTGRRTLRIRNANEDDTGVFVCKGVNGFGTEQVRVELVVVDPRQLPPAARDGSLPRVAPPVFTHETRAAAAAEPVQHLSVGQTFRASCEALGSPRPDIFWFKDGEHISESVRHDAHRSTVEFSVLGPADGGVYSCRARNLVGESSVTYTLKVRQSRAQAAAHAVVSEVGPRNVAVRQGEDARLRCRVKAISKPNVKWLKKIVDDANGDLQDLHGERTLRVGHESYRVLDNSREVMVEQDEYVSTLSIPGARPDDSGMYICFVTNSGFAKFTYVSMMLSVTAEGRTFRPTEMTPVVIDDAADAADDSDREEPLAMLVLAACLSTTVILLLVCIGFVVYRKQQLRSSSSNSKSPLPPSPLPDAPDDVQRPFIMSSAKVNGNTNNNTYHLPLPPTTANSGESNSSSSGVLGGRGRHRPYHHQQQQQSNNPWTLASRGGLVYPAADSGFDASTTTGSPKDLLDSSLNQYEVPYSHLLPRSEGGPGYAFRPVYCPTTVHHHHHQGRSLSDRAPPVAALRNPFDSSSSNNSNSNRRPQQLQQQYFGGHYDSQ